MQYMFLIYNAEGDEPAPGTPEFDEMMQGYRAFTEEVRPDVGVVVGGTEVGHVHGMLHRPHTEC